MFTTDGYLLQLVRLRLPNEEMLCFLSSELASANLTKD